LKLKHLLLGLVILTVAVYGGAKTYIYFKAKEELDKLVQMASPFVEISYGDISSDLRGSLKITDLDLISLAGGESMQIGSMEIKGSGPGFLLELTEGFKKSGPPADMVLHIGRASVPVDQGFGANFDITGMGGGNSNPSQEAKPCTLGGILQHKGLDEIGIDALSADATFGYRNDRKSSEVNVFVDYQLDSIESLSMELELGNMPEPGSMVMGQMPSIENFELNYTVEPAYIKRSVEHCAKLAGKDPELFTRELFDQSDSRYARELGFIPGPGIREMLESLISKGGQLAMTANPSMELDPMVLALSKPEDVIEMLGIELTLDDKPVKDLSMEFPSDGQTLSLLPELQFIVDGEKASVATGTTDPEKNSSARNSGKPGKIELRYVETMVADLHRYIGKKVRLYTNTSVKPKQGYLVSSKGEIVSVKQNIHHGSMTAHLPMAVINKAEVLQRVPLSTAQR
jgi:hypothetical protein